MEVSKPKQVNYIIWKTDMFFLCLGVRFDAFTHFETLVALLLYSTEAVKQLFNFLHASKWKKQKVDVNKKEIEWNEINVYQTSRHNSPQPS